MKILNLNLRKQVAADKKNAESQNSQNHNIRRHPELTHIGERAAQRIDAISQWIQPDNGR